MKKEIKKGSFLFLEEGDQVKVIKVISNYFLCEFLEQSSKGPPGSLILLEAGNAALYLPVTKKSAKLMEEYRKKLVQLEELKDEMYSLAFDLVGY